MNKTTLTIEELIQELESARDKFGPHAEVFKRRTDVGDGSNQLMPISKIKIDHHAGVYCITI